jgi:hypothetical protein
MQAIRKPSLALNANKYERSVTVFNSSVENHVENAAARFKSPRQYRIYSRLHKDSAIESRRNFLSEQSSSVRFIFVSVKWQRAEVSTNAGDLRA